MEIHAQTPQTRESRPVDKHTLNSSKSGEKRSPMHHNRKCKPERRFLKGKKTLRSSKVREGSNCATLGSCVRYQRGFFAVFCEGVGFGCVRVERHVQLFVIKAFEDFRKSNFVGCDCITNNENLKLHSKFIKKYSNDGIIAKLRKLLSFS